MHLGAIFCLYLPLEARAELPVLNIKGACCWLGRERGLGLTISLGVFGSHVQNPGMLIWWFLEELMSFWRSGYKFKLEVLSKKRFGLLCFFPMLWSLWMLRSKITFNEARWNFQHLFWKIKFRVCCCIKMWEDNFVYNPHDFAALIICEHWLRPRLHALFLFFILLCRFVKLFKLLMIKERYREKEVWEDYHSAGYENGHWMAGQRSDYRTPARLSLFGSLWGLNNNFGR